jgi:hypothetical protein
MEKTAKQYWLSFAAFFAIICPVFSELFFQPPNREPPLPINF